MNLNKIACSIAASPTLALNEEANRLRAAGEPVINLGIGEPQNSAPAAAINCAVERLKTGKVKYAPAGGIQSLKIAIADYTQDNYGLVVEQKQIVVTQGAKQALFNVLYVLSNPGDEILLIAPYWVSYPEMVRMVGATPVFIQTENKELIPSMQEIESAITGKTKAIIVNSPNNPSGAVYPEGLISDIVALCEKRNIFLICDDIYHKLVFDGNRAAPAYTFSTFGPEESNIIAVNGVAKLYGMTGFRIGWTISNSRIAEILANIQAQTISCVSPVMQEAAAGALNGEQQVVEDLRQAMQQNRDIVVHGFKSFDNVRCMKPAGTFYAFPDFHELIDGKRIKDSVELASFILQKAKVVTVPGKEFGVEGHLRLSYALDPDSVSEGIERIRWALDHNAPERIQIGEKTCVRNWR